MRSINGGKHGPGRVLDLLRHTPLGQEVRAWGWVRTRRDSKAGFSFLELNDGSCMANIQVLAPRALENYETEILRITAGSSIEVEGVIVESPGAGQDVELRANRLKVLGWADPERYPLQKKRHSLEFLRTVAHLRPRTNAFGAMARVRNSAADVIHRFFQERGFVQLHAPILTGNDCEGAGAQFQVTTLDFIHAQGGREMAYSEDFFGKPAYLTVSGQLEAEAYAMALGRVYTFGPAFRAENSNTPRHLAEFWMVEPEVAFFDLEDNADLAEEFLKSVVRDVLEQSAEDLDLFCRFVDASLPKAWALLTEQSFERMTYTEALERISRAPRSFEATLDWGADLQAEHERYLAEELCGRPVILTDYPKDLKPFYMRVNEDGKTVAGMDILLPRVGEIVGGSQREERYDVLLARMNEAGLDENEYGWYLDLRRYGTAPHSGFGLGFDRLLQFITGMGNIRDVVPFPRTPRQLEF